MTPMFSCPQCRGRTISLRAKAGASIFRPVACANCGALLIVSRRAVLAALAVANLSAVPILLAGGAVAFTAAASGVLLVGVLGCIYSFGFAPMEQLARAEPEQQWTAPAIMLAVVLLAAVSLVALYAIFRP
jgi:hypothetical protein